MIHHSLRTWVIHRPDYAALILCLVSEQLQADDLRRLLLRVESHDPLDTSAPMDK